MGLSPGTRIGVYEVVAQIGAGGMGEVYRARDTRLKRDVALKILPDSFASDAERLARFQREAEVLASLNHPNIAQVHGVEESGALTALVMELVEGEDLSQHVARAPIPLDEALPIARQICEALEAAHEQGIIHRDLKPANIKITPSGTVKVLDFGLAKAIDPAGVRSARASMSPTFTSPAMMTGVGMILGTAAYMAPEQARGKTVDKRADIWAFGCVLFEMLTGRRAFEEDDVAMTVSKVLQREPDFDALPSSVPPRVRVAIRACLRKDAKQRVGDIRDVRLALDGTFETPALHDVASALTRRSRAGLAWMGAFVLAVIAAALAIPAVQHLREPPPAETRTDIVTPPTEQPTAFALSPDGQQIVFVAGGEGGSRLWLRSLATTSAQPLAGTESASAPFWSPDGRSIGFFATGALKRLDLGGGPPRTLAPAINGRGGTWNADGVIVFAPSQTTPLMRISATGGAATPATQLATEAIGHLSPEFLPGGRRLLLYVRGGPDIAGIYLGSLDGSAPTRLVLADTAGAYVPSGWLLWARAGTLIAQRLDVAQSALTGEPITVANGVAEDGVNRSAVSVAATGLIAYRTGGSNRHQLTWVDRTGAARGTVGDPDGTISMPRIAPDGRRVAVSRAVQANVDIWVIDGARTSRLTFAAGLDRYPVWSPDGQRIAYRSGGTGVGDLYVKLTTGAGVEEPLLISAQSKIPTSWSTDGRLLLYHSLDPETNGDLWALPMTGDRTPSEILKSPFRQAYAEFSPDGRWMAYHSNESGRPEVYVRPFAPATAPGIAGPTGIGQWQVSTNGGVFPAWRADGKELYYLDPSGAVMAAPITLTGGTVAAGVPVTLFSAHIVGGGEDVQQGRQYDVAADGRFLVNRVLDENAAPITLLQYWNPEAIK